MNDEYIDSSEWAQMATASTSKHHCESSEEEPLRKIPKLSGVLCEITSQAKLQAAVISNNPNAEPEITSQAKLQAAVLPYNPSAEPEIISQAELQAAVLSNYLRAEHALQSDLVSDISDVESKDEDADFKKYQNPSVEHADLESDPVSDITDDGFEDEDAEWTEYRKNRHKRLKKLFGGRRNAHLLGKGTKLHDAVLCKNSNAVHAVLLSDPSLIDVQDSYGKTALHYAASCGFGKIVKILLDKGANTDLQDENGLTPLHDMLCGTSWGWGGSGGYDVGVFQMCVDEKYIKVMEELLASSADAHLPDKHNRTPLHIALGKGNSIGAEMIVDAKGGNNIQDERGKTPLHLAAGHQYRETAKKLLTAGVSTRIRDNRGKTPLHVAVNYRENPIVNYFVDADSENDLQDSFGQTPLHFTARDGRILATRKLLYCGAHPHIKAEIEEERPMQIEAYPLGIALKNRRRAVAEMILSACVLRGIVIDWEVDLDWKEELDFMDYKKASTVEFYQDMCVEFDVEVQKMKNAKLCGTAISYYDFAIKHERKLAPYLKNKDICLLLRSINLDDHFPNYGRLLTFKIKRARKRNTLIASCLKCFSVLSKKYPSLLKINIDSILEYLNERDMLNFVKAFDIKS